MSHFTVAVFHKEGEEVDDLLSPFEECKRGHSPRWDWWVIGGRWKNKLKLFTGSYVDSTEVKYIDFDGMERDKREKLGKEWDEYDKNPDSHPFMFWDRDKKLSRDEYIEEYARFITWAVILNGEWLEPGRMGWFGSTSAEEGEEERWSDEYMDRFIKSADPDMVLTIVDCHT